MTWIPISKLALAQTKAHFTSKGYSNELLWYTLASEIAILTLGYSWWQQHCVEGAKDQQHYFHADDEQSDDRWNHQTRIISLGHWLFFLQDCGGFQTFRVSLQQQDLESALFELESAYLLRRSGLNVRFIKPSGVI